MTFDPVTFVMSRDILEPILFFRVVRCRNYDSPVKRLLLARDLDIARVLTQKNKV